MQREIFSNVLPIALYFLIATAFFLPVLLSPDSVFLGYFADIGMSLQTLAFMQYNLEHGIDSTHSDLLNAPFGSDISQYGNFEPSVVFLVFPLSLATTPLAAYNIMLFLGPLLSAIAMYFLARHFIKSRHACFISGIIYGFSPYILARAVAAHISLVHGAWVALYVLALFRFNEKKSWANALFLGVSLAAVGFFSYYYLYFAVISTGIFYLYKFWGARKELPFRARKALRSPAAFVSEQRHYLAAITVFLLLFSVLILPFVLAMLLHSESSIARGVLGGRTNIMHAVYLSAWPHLFLTPSVYHPLFKEPVSEFLLTLPGMNFTGATVFIGFTALALSLFALIKHRGNRFVRFFLFAAVATLILAIGPFMRYTPFLGLTITFVPAMLAIYSSYAGNIRWAKIFALAFAALLFFPLLYPLLPLIQQPAAQLIGLPQLQQASTPEVIQHLEKYKMLPIPMPSLPLFLALPLFRMLARLDIILMLCIAVIAGFGVQSLLERAPSVNKKHALTFLFSALILFEAINFPPYMLTDASETPPEYAWLAEQPGSPIVLEYPIGWEYFYSFYQLKHMKPIMNGGVSGEFEILRPHILDPTRAETLSILAGFGVKYVITHDDYFLEQIPDSLPDKKFALRWMSNEESRQFTRLLDETHESLPGIELVKEFSHAKVYRITAEPKEFMFGA